MLVLPVFMGNYGITRASPRGVGSPRGGYMMYSSVPPVFLETDDAREEGLEPPMAGMALEAARAIILPPSPERAGP